MQIGITNGFNFCSRGLGGVKTTEDFAAKNTRIGIKVVEGSWKLPAQTPQKENVVIIGSKAGNNKKRLQAIKKSLNLPPDTSLEDTFKALVKMNSQLDINE